MTLWPPLFMQAVTGDTAITYAAQDLRRLTAALAPQQGTVLANDLMVSQRGAGANLSVDVAAGQAFVAGTTTAGQGTYMVRSDAVTNVPLQTASASNPRIDLIVARVFDKQADGGTSYSWTIQAITGTAAASPVAPAAPASSLILAQVSVPTSATSITNTRITDRRVLSGQGDVPKWDFTGSTGQPIASSTLVQYIPNQTLQLVGVNATGTTVSILTPGRYVVSFGGRITVSSVACNRIMSVAVVNKSGTTTRRIANALSATTYNLPCAVSQTIYLSVGDTIVPYIWQESGGSLNADDTQLEWNFTGVWVGS